VIEGRQYLNQLLCAVHSTSPVNLLLIRDRDNMAQERVPIAELDRIVREKVDLKLLLRQL